MVKNMESKKITCDGCGQQATPDDADFYEFISVSHRCGSGSIHGEGNQFSIDLCQQCFVDMCGNSLTIIAQSKNEASGLKDDGDLLIAARDILEANKIINTQALNVALKRVEQLWDTQFHSAESNELHQLAELICAYENKS
jgi:hypothetical protein